MTRDFAVNECLYVTDIRSKPFCFKLAAPEESAPIGIFALFYYPLDPLEVVPLVKQLDFKLHGMQESSVHLAHLCI